MWSFQDNYLHTSDEKPARPEPINVQAPVSISNVIPRSITEEQRDLWHTMLADVDNNIGMKTREEVYEEQKRQFYNDYYAGLEERLVSGKSQPTPSELYAFRLAREKWETKNLVGIENSYEYELASRKAFWDIMDSPEEYQYAKTGDTVEDTTNALTNDLILTRALYNKTKQISLPEEILAQFAQESAAGYAGGSIGATGGSIVGGGIGAAIGAYVGANESIYQYRKAKIGHGTPSVNTVAEKFLEEYNALCNLYLNKTDFNKAVVGLVDKYLTDRNWDYWGDISTVILSGQRSFLDLGPLTGLLISTGLKGVKGIYKGLRPALGPKTMKQATQQAVKDAQALQVYKQRKANGEDVVYDGEIVSGQILKNSDNASPNAGMSQEGITIDAESWTTYEPGGEIIMTYVNPETGDIVRYKSFRNIGSGSVSLIGEMKKQNMIEEVGTSVGVKDVDSTLNNDVVTLVGTGADYTQPFESVRAAEKALARWNIQLKDNQVPVVVEQGTDQYYLGVVENSDKYTGRFMDKIIVPENLKIDDTYNSVDNLSNIRKQNFEKNRNRFLVVAKDTRGQDVIASYDHSLGNTRADSFIAQIREGALTYLEGRRDLSARQKLDQFALQNFDRIPENVFKRAMYYDYLSSRKWHDTEKARGVFEKTGKKNQFKNAGLYGVLKEDRKIKSPEDYLNVSIDNVQSLLNNKKIYWHTEKFNSFEEAKEYADNIKSIKDNLNIDEIDEDIRELFDSSETMPMDELLKNDGKRIKNVLKFIDNDRILKYNYKTKTWQFGEVRGFQ